MSEEKEKTKYRVKNWGEYNQALIKRGSLTIWFEAQTVRVGW